MHCRKVSASWGRSISSKTRCGARLCREPAARSYDGWLAGTAFLAAPFPLSPRSLTAWCFSSYAAQFNYSRFMFSTFLPAGTSKVCLVAMGRLQGSGHSFNYSGHTLKLGVVA